MDQENKSSDGRYQHLRVADRPDSILCTSCTTYLTPSEQHCPRCGAARSTERRIVIDLRNKEPEVYKELDAELVIEVDLYDKGYSIGYKARQPNGAYALYSVVDSFEREAMVKYHVGMICELKPKSVVIRTGKHSTGHVQDIPLHPGVIKSIIEGKLDAAKLTLPG